MPYIFCFQCLSKRFLKEFSIPANMMLDGKLFQLFITLKEKKNCLVGGCIIFGHMVFSTNKKEKRMKYVLWALT